jgi:regulator of protease activity HflC (stomatin/prohibitin superfamily)
LLLPVGYRVEKLDVSEPFAVTGFDLDVFLKDEELAKELSVIEVADHEIAMHYIEGRFNTVLKSGKYAFWNVLKQHTFQVVDLNNPEVSVDIDRSVFNHTCFRGYAVCVDVGSHEKSLLFFDNKLVRTLEPGRYFYWNKLINVTMNTVDLRQKQLDMTGQEIMTEDKITLRINFTCQYKIKDPVTTLLTVKDYEQQIYILLQLVLWEYVGSLKLDELLKMKQEVSDYVISRLRDKEAQFGVEFIYAGVKDLILPGEIKDILNTVLVAEKRAQANISTRREETASTRSLLNTARLMDENKTLYKLKEIEYLEKICENVGNISVSNGGGLVAQLQGILAGKTDSL